jgi:mlo protein
MGNSFKKSVFDDNVTEGLAAWAEKARRRRTNVYATNSPTIEANSGEIQLQNTRGTSLVEQGTTRLV